MRGAGGTSFLKFLPFSLDFPLLLLYINGIGAEVTMSSIAIRCLDVLGWLGSARTGLVPRRFEEWVRPVVMRVWLGVV